MTPTELTQRDALKAEIIGWMNKGIPRGKTIPDFENLVDTLIQHAVEAAREAERERHSSIYKWLLGESGEFPNLAEKPHYSFRTELRKRIEALTPTPEQGEITNPNDTV